MTDSKAATPDSNTPTAPAVVLDIRDHVAHIRLNRPKCLNALDVDTAKGILGAVTEASATPTVRVIVLSGEGRAFLAGGDLAYFQAAGDKASEAARTLIDPIHKAIAALAAAPQPVIASVHGAVAGAGMSLALIADLVIAADNTVFNSAYIKVANSPDCSGTWALPRLVGMRKALEIALLSENIDANEALQLNLINRIAPLAELEQATDKMAQQLASAAPLAVASIKRLIRQSHHTTLQTQLDEEGESFANNAGTEDFQEALSAFFEKRAATFKGQ